MEQLEALRHAYRIARDAILHEQNGLEADEVYYVRDGLAARALTLAERHLIHEQLDAVASILEDSQERLLNSNPQFAGGDYPDWVTYHEDDVTGDEIWGCIGCFGTVTRAGGTPGDFEESLIAHKDDCPYRVPKEKAVHPASVADSPHNWDEYPVWLLYFEDDVNVNVRGSEVWCCIGCGRAVIRALGTPAPFAFRLFPHQQDCEHWEEVPLEH